MSTRINAATNDGGPAFPTADTYHPDGQIEFGCNGMSLRDWFAGRIVPSVLTSADNEAFRVRAPDEPADEYRTAYNEWVQGAFLRDAETAYTIADAMIAARNGKEENP